MRESLARRPQNRPETQSSSVDLLPWPKAVRQQALFLAYQHLLPSDKIPECIRPAFPKDGSAHRDLKTPDQKNAAWKEQLEQQEAHLLHTYEMHANQVQLPNEHQFAEYVNPILANDNPQKGRLANPVKSLLQMDLATNPVLYRRVLDALENAEINQRPMERLRGQTPEEKHLNEEKTDRAKKYFPALDLLDSPLEPKGISPENRTRLTELEQNPDLVEEVRAIRERLLNKKGLPENELNPQELATRRRYQLEAQINSSNETTRARLEQMLSNPEYDYDPEEITQERPIQTPAIDGQTTWDQDTAADPQPDTSLNPVEAEAIDAAERERVWAESYFIPLHALENGFSLSALTEEERAKVQQLKENRNLLQSIYGLREKARGESINRREAAMQKAQELIREIMDPGETFGFQHLREEGGPALIQAYAQLEKILAEEKKSSSHQLSPEDRRRLETQLSDLKSCYDVLYATPL